ncbi:phytanoyl-CoA dioxygenase family protein [Sphingomonas kaistensis]|uniref:Phytanoyl-CoA dioxygenase family protein n=1 Tax=Sphingomonas kaistensis TaxID=298708 RepID=A0ABZ2G344_9SPHN
MTIDPKLLPGIPLIESPIYAGIVDQLGLTDDERRVADSLHERGYAVIDFPDPEVLDRIDRIKRRLAPRFGLDPEDPARRLREASVRRVQDAWLEDEDVRAIAANPTVLALLGKLYGRRPIPFQTLNFPVGTEQKLHSDSNHFSSLPERFMCGVWLAMEDVHPDAGPLTYAPGSHKWPIISNLMIGRRGRGGQTHSAQAPFEAAWDALLEIHGSESELLIAKKGQALIWAANLLHGGSFQNDKSLTRWSQVTHYYFEDCIYYTPAFSDEAVGDLAVRSITDVVTGDKVENRYLGQAAEALLQRSSAPAEDEPEPSGWWQRRRKRASAPPPTITLPPDFDAKAYLELNPDVAAAGIDPAAHYLRYGFSEGRAYRTD